MHSLSAQLVMPIAIKQKKRNRMKPSTSSNLLLAREAVNDLTIDGKFEPTKSMIDRLIEGHYYDDLSD